MYPRRRGRCSAAHVEGDPTDSAIRKTVGGCFLTPDARLLGRDPVRVPGDDWLLQVVLNTPGASWIAALQEREQAKNEEEELGLGQRMCMCFVSIVVLFQSAITSSI